MYIIGQEHKVLVDNKEFKDYTYINNTIIVRIDDVELKLRKNSRKVVYVVGPKHKILLEYNGKIIEKNFKVPVNHNVLINIPALVNEDPDFIKFVNFRE